MKAYSWNEALEDPTMFYMKRFVGRKTFIFDLTIRALSKKRIGFSFDKQVVSKLVNVYININVWYPET